MNITIRKYSRLFATVGLSLFMFAIRYLAKIIRPFSKTLDRRVRQSLFKFGARGIVFCSGLRREIRGKPPLPPYFLVSNHLSFLDIFLLASELGCVFVSKDDLAGWPVFGFMAREMDTIFINRERLKDTLRVNELVTKAMQDGYGIVVFAESGISPDGKIMPFKPALFESPARLGIPVHYASIHYITPQGYPPASEVALWRDGVTFLEHYLGLTALPYCKAVLTFGEAPIVGEDRKVLAQELCEAVRAQFTPLD